MTATLTFHPLGNADCIRIDLADGRKVLVDYADVRNESDPFDKRCDLLYLHSGTTGQLEERIQASATALTKALRDSGVKNVVFRDAKGYAHEWQTWRYALHDLAPRLFQQPATLGKP